MAFKSFCDIPNLESRLLHDVLLDAPEKMTAQLDAIGGQQLDAKGIENSLSAQLRNGLVFIIF
jgi:hypothetical protein